MQSRYIYFVRLFLIYFKWFQIYSIERTKRTSIYSTQEVVMLSRKPETHFIVLVCWLCDLIYKILSSFTEIIFSTYSFAIVIESIIHTMPSGIEETISDQAIDVECAANFNKLSTLIKSCVDFQSV